tara:strand:+ start:198 stop:380 length:183 start_codon:yes stop_codon:yes gene_type:complete
MEIIKQVNKYQLYKHELTNLFAVSDDNNVSLWFDKYTKDELIYMNDKEFIKECINMLEED